MPNKPVNLTVKSTKKANLHILKVSGSYWTGGKLLINGVKQDLKEGDYYAAPGSKVAFINNGNPRSRMYIASEGDYYEPSWGKYIDCGRFTNAIIKNYTLEHSFGGGTYADDDSKRDDNGPNCAGLYFIMPAKEVGVGVVDFGLDDHGYDLAFSGDYDYTGLVPSVQFYN